MGLKSDLRDKQDAIEGLKKSGQEPVSLAHAEGLSKELKAYKYLECSSLTQVGMADVFEEAVRCVINPAGSRVSVVDICCAIHIYIYILYAPLLTPCPYNNTLVARGDKCAE